VLKSVNAYIEMLPSIIGKRRECA